MNIYYTQAYNFIEQNINTYRIFYSLLLVEMKFTRIQTTI